RRGEFSLFGGDGQIAGRDQLAPGGGRHSLNFSDDWLRDALDRIHHLDAGVEYLAVIADRTPAHLRQVVARRKDPPAGRENHRLCFVRCADLPQTGGQFAHQRQRKRVAPFRAIERNARYGRAHFDNQVLIIGGHLLPRQEEGGIVAILQDSTQLQNPEKILSILSTIIGNHYQTTPAYHSTLYCVT